MIGDGDEVRFDWRRGGAAAAGLLAALVLLGMVFLVKLSNDTREHALAAERHAYEVALVVRNASSNVSRSEAGLARFVLDEDPKTSGNIYASDWQLAGFQIGQLAKLIRGNPAQERRVAEVQRLYRIRGEELALAARAAAAKEGQNGISYYYAAARSGTGQDLDDMLEDITRAERQSLRERIAQSQFFSSEADRFTDYLSWLGILVGAGAIFLGVVAVQALRQNALARRRAHPPFALLRPLGAAASRARGQQGPHRRHVGPARPDPRRAHQSRSRSRPRHLADLRRPASARKRHRQPCGQRPRRDGRPRRDAHRDPEREARRQ